jgi:hypothetical protein
MSHYEDPLDYFLKVLREGKIAFFVGSGISYCKPSELPSACNLLKDSCDLMLPTNEAGLVKKITGDDRCREGMQPEAFYEQALAILGPRGIKPLERLKDRVPPNINHKFLAAYAVHNVSPLVTTNFDTLLEEASNGIGHPLRRVTPRKLEDLLPQPAIYKVHGSIDELTSDNLPDVFTTMPSITSKNEKTINLIEKIMMKWHLCFVGYSGRDFDIFPHIAPLSDTSDALQPFWIDLYPNEALQKMVNALSMPKSLEDIIKEKSHEIGSALGKFGWVVKKPRRWARRLK